ncbi:MAG: hypothetical protein VX938_07275, partial [Myxococcota bacterium]|nr:hypothetical protein [Myxococcota bacterium]
MNRTLIGLLIAMLLLGALAVSLVGQDEPAPAEGWSIEGFATPEQLQADRERGMLDPQVDMPSPIDEIEISRAEGDVRLVKIGEGPKPDWALRVPQEAPAVRFRVDNMVKLFKDETVSIHSTKLTPEDRPLFDLEEGRAIHVKMKANGALWQGVDLLIGKVDTSEEESLGPVPTKDTWVQLTSQPDVAYRIGGKDLRAPFESPLKDLRDRRLFSLKPEELATLKITPPGGQTISLKGTHKE